MITGDPSVEAIFLRDEIADCGPHHHAYRVDAPHGSSRPGLALIRIAGIAVDLLQFVPLDDPVKIPCSRSPTPRRTRKSSGRLCRMGARTVRELSSPSSDRNRCGTGAMFARIR